MKASQVFGPMFASGRSAMHRTGRFPRSHPQLPARRVGGADPILVLGTTRDPATPYEWAKAKTHQLNVGPSRDPVGDGHTAYASGNA